VNHLPPNNRLLYVVNVYKRYGAKTVLENVDLAVTRGELCTVVGPSGCGKSTLLRLILGQEAPSQGQVLLKGEPVGFPGPDRGIVYQKYSLFPHLTVLGNVVLGKSLSEGIIRGFFKKRRFSEEALSYLEKVKLAEHKDKYPHELSGGMQQRVAIAQALIMKPEILLMDEPFGALDPGTREHMQVLLLELWEQLGMTVFFVTHDLEEAVFLGTRLIVISQYYTDDRGPQFNSRGARITADYALPRKAVATSVKEKADFGQFIQQIRRDGFDPSYIKHVSEFNLLHEDSFQTLTWEEDHNGQGEAEPLNAERP
jgi:NitT/TauT family transport system ATP-binding protein